MVNLGVLVSGSGSNLQAIIDNIEAGRVDAKIKIVISNVPEVYALERARKHGIPSLVIPHKGLKREEYDQKLVEALRAHGVELVVLAGFMRIITPVLLRAFPMRVINIHPALLPAFPGTHVWQTQIDYGVKFAGCTVHFVDEGTDTGPIIIQAVVPVYDDDTADDAERPDPEAGAQDLFSGHPDVRRGAAGDSGTPGSGQGDAQGSGFFHDQPSGQDLRLMNWGHGIME